MRIAFVGKGGSGKTTSAAMFSRYWPRRVSRRWRSTCTFAEFAHLVLDDQQTHVPSMADPG
jgi:ABC-type glutathione transport system ATPase component